MRDQLRNVTVREVCERAGGEEEKSVMVLGDVETMGVVCEGEAYVQSPKSQSLGWREEEQKNPQEGAAGEEARRESALSPIFPYVRSA
jgi:hypothetical protein